jgi:glutamate racemase
LKPQPPHSSLDPASEPAPLSPDAPLIIGIRDSGVGGLTVARAIRQVLPHARLLYFADTAHVPYGDRRPEEVKYFALSISRFLLAQGAQALVFACNTTSAYALDDARREFDCPVIGMIEPGARAALSTSRNGRIGVLATQATVDSLIYTRTLERFNKDGHEMTVKEVACPEFVPLVEEERTDSPAAHEAARKYLAPLLRSGCDTVILGCTHYPLLLPALHEAAPQIAFVDPALAVAQAVREHSGVLSAVLNEHSEDVFFVSGEAAGVERWVKELLDVPAPRLERGPVFEFEHDRQPVRS